MAYSNISTPHETARSDGKLISVPVAASTKIYKGSMVTLDADGYAVFATVGASLPFAGVAYETVDNSTGSDGDMTVRVETTGVFSFSTTSAAEDWKGKTVYLDSSDTGSPIKVVDSDPGDTALTVGVVVQVPSADTVRVRIDGYAMNKLCDAS